MNTKLAFCLAVMREAGGFQEIRQRLLIHTANEARRQLVEAELGQCESLKWSGAPFAIETRGFVQETSNSTECSAITRTIAWALLLCETIGIDSYTRRVEVLGDASPWVRDVLSSSDEVLVATAVLISYVRDMYETTGGFARGSERLVPFLHGLEGVLLGEAAYRRSTVFADKTRTCVQVAVAQGTHDPVRGRSVCEWAVALADRPPEDCTAWQDVVRDLQSRLHRASLDILKAI